MTALKQFLAILLKRLFSKTPAYLVKIQWICGVLATGVGGLIAYLTETGQTGNKYFPYLVSIASALAFAVAVLQLATTDKELQKKS